MSAEHRRPELFDQNPEVEEGEHGHDRSHAAMRALAVADTVERPRTLTEILRTPAAKIISSLTAAAVIGGGILIGWNNKSEEVGARPETSSSAPEKPGVSPSESATESAETQFETKTPYAATLEATELFKSLGSEQQTTIRRYDAMTLADFRKLPEEEQMVFGDFYTRAHEAYGMEQLKRSPFYHAPSGEDLGEDAPGQAIVDGFAERQAIVFYSLAENGSPYNINEGKREDAQKALAGLYPQLLADSKVYENTVTQIGALQSLEADGSNTYNGDGYIVRTVEAESPTGPHTGAMTKFIDINSPKSGPQQYVFNHSTFTDIEGNQKGDWRLKMVVGKDSSLYTNVNTVFTS